MNRCFALSGEELRVKKIKNGTVIDHIPAGHALTVLKILGITGEEGLIIAVLMNVPSKKIGKKDIVKIENMELKKEEVSKISLIAPNATINIIRNFRVIKKFIVEIPSRIQGLLRCINPTCISRKRNEPIESSFKVISKQPLKLQCEFCGTYIEYEDIVSQF